MLKVNAKMYRVLDFSEDESSDPNTSSKSNMSNLTYKLPKDSGSSTTANGYKWQSRLR